MVLLKVKKDLFGFDAASNAQIRIQLHGSTALVEQHYSNTGQRKYVVPDVIPSVYKMLTA